MSRRTTEPKTRGESDAFDMPVANLLDVQSIDVSLETSRVLPRGVGAAEGKAPRHFCTHNDNLHTNDASFP